MKKQWKYIPIKYQIIQVFKGNNKIVNGTIEITGQEIYGGIMPDGRFVLTEHGYHYFIPPMNGIFFGVASTYPTNGKTITVYTQKDKYQAKIESYTFTTNYITLQYYNSYCFDGGDYEMNKIFKTKQEIYDFLKTSKQ